MGEASVSAEQPQESPPARVSPPHVDPSRSGDPVGAPAQRSAQAVGVTHPSTVKGKKAFAALLRRGRRVRRGTITITWLAGDPAEPPRVAYAVGRRTGGAVVRNRIRRRLRAVIREVGAELAPGSYLIGAGPEAATLPYGELRATVSEALRMVVR